MWTWKNWLALAGVVAGSILLSFIVQWHITTGWRVFWLDGLIQWWGDFVMFGWVAEYQTLLGGMLAVAAGSFVLLSALVQREDRSRALQEERHEALLSTVATLKRMWVIAEYRLNVQAPVASVRAVLEDIAVRANALPVSAHELAARLSVCCSFVLTSLEDYVEIDDGNNEERLDDAKRGVFLIVAYLDDHEQLVQDGKFQHFTRTLTPEQAEEAHALRVFELLPNFATSMVRLPDD